MPRLSEICRWRIGGPAVAIHEPRDIGGLVELLGSLRDSVSPFVIVGSGSNLLFSDEGLRVPCIRLGKGFDAISIEGNVVTAGASAWVPGLARRIMQAGLTGAEHVCGIPGTFGGLLYMNGGSMRRSIGDSVLDVTSVTPKGEIRTRSAAECGFDYRSSAFQALDEIIVSARLHLPERRDRGAIRREMLRILADRRRKFPKNMPNCGSVFISHPDMYAKFGSPGEIIERLGLKGRRIGDAEISVLHANWINNLGNAKASDVLALVRMIVTDVARQTGFQMKAEAKFVTPGGAFLPLDEAAMAGIGR